MMISVSPYRCLSASTVSSSLSTLTGERPAAGSSSISSFGCMGIARASASSRRLPARHLAGRHAAVVGEPDEGEQLHHLVISSRILPSARHTDGRPTIAAGVRYRMWQRWPTSGFLSTVICKKMRSI